MIGLSLSGATSSFLDLQISARRLDETLRGAVKDLAAEYNSRLKAEIARPKGGRQYGAGKGRRFGRKLRRTVVFGQAAKVREVQARTIRTRAYTASAPGQAPAVRTGNLLRAVRVKFPSRQKGYGAKVFANRGLAFYRHFLEFGAGPAKRGKRIGAGGVRAARPVFSPLQAQLEAELERRVARAADLFAAFQG